MLGYNLYAYVSNNPINMADPNGELAWAIPALGLGSIATALLGAVLITGAIVIGVTVVASLVNSKPKVNDKAKDNTVYTLRDDKSNVVYVGRTTKPEERREAHKTNPTRATLQFNTEMTGLTKNQARGLEQAMIVWHKTLNRENPANNQINGIRWDNPKYFEYMTDAIDYITAVTSVDGKETYVGRR